MCPDQESDASVPRSALNPQSHTSQGWCFNISIFTLLFFDLHLAGYRLSSGPCPVTPGPRACPLWCPYWVPRKVQGSNAQTSNSCVFQRPTKEKFSLLVLFPSSRHTSPSQLLTYFQLWRSTQDPFATLYSSKTFFLMIVFSTPSNHSAEVSRLCRLIILLPIFWNLFSQLSACECARVSECVCERVYSHASFSLSHRLTTLNYKVC